ncbi:hAT-like transposase, RNase-H fold [Dillenia turbinata]|uniref:HAT-like transposase, RNase-H fold n=1 Tax=Dillenia turbinata TaxID=194707 RepID=A0AAN8V0H1_9MAGN
MARLHKQCLTCLSAPILPLCLFAAILSPSFLSTLHPLVSHLSSLRTASHISNLSKRKRQSPIWYNFRRIFQFHTFMWNIYPKCFINLQLMSSTGENKANKAAYEIESTAEKDTQCTVPPPSSSYPVDQSKRPLPNEIKNKNYNAGSRLKSWVWDHFIKVEGLSKNEQKATCTYCSTVMACLARMGTSCLSNHLKGSYYVTGNEYMKEIYGIDMILDKICESEDSGTASMASKIKRKHDKYWGNIDKINVFLFIFIILDPRFKLNYVNWVIEHSYDVNKVVLLKSKKFRDMKSIALSILKNEEFKLKSEYSSIRVLCLPFSLLFQSSTKYGFSHITYLSNHDDRTLYRLIRKSWLRFSNRFSRWFACLSDSERNLSAEFP